MSVLLAHFGTSARTPKYCARAAAQPLRRLPYFVSALAALYAAGSAGRARQRSPGQRAKSSTPGRTTNRAKKLNQSGPASARRERPSRNPLRRRWLALAAIVVGGGLAAYLAWPRASADVVREMSPADIRVAGGGAPQAAFTDITRQAGIDFRHENGAIGKKLLPETMGGGCAFFDFDNDGDQDVLFVNSLRRWPWDRTPADPAEPTMALYQNDGTGKFSDVTAGSGLDVSLYGMGAAVGDYDNDGRVDVFLSALGDNRLFRNEGNGNFRDVTATAGVAGGEREWSTSSGFVDYDNDGDLDLFVCNYLQWSREFDESQRFQFADGGRAYGRPQSFPGTFPYLYRNEGDGRFTEVAAEAGLAVRDPATGLPLAKSLGVVFADLDRDGWIDIVVANDTVQNFLFHNQKDGTFREMGTESGIAFDANGNARGAMGIDVARFREGDAVGVVIGNFSNEMAAQYVAYGTEMQFTDEADISGLGANTRQELTFGVFFADYDLDGRLDLFAANGHLEYDIRRVQPSQQYEQPPQLFWNSGSGGGHEFVPVSADRQTTDFARPMVGRGAAYADIDGDGDLDVLFTGIGQAPRLLRNDQQQNNHWLRFKLVGTRVNRDAIGAAVEVELADGRTLHRQVAPTRSYLSQVELPVTFGLGNVDRVHRVTVTWPDGSQQEVRISQVDRTYEIKQDTSPPRDREVGAAHSETYGNLSETHLPPLSELGASPQGPTSPLPGDASESASDSADSQIADFRSQIVLTSTTGSNNPQSAIRNPQLTHASCGSHLHLDLLTQYDQYPSQEPVPGSLPGRPCRGPSCSKGPGQQPGQAPTAPRLSDQGQSLLLAACDAPRSDAAICFIPSRSAGLAPRLDEGGIFRPPRLS